MIAVAPVAGVGSCSEPYPVRAVLLEGETMGSNCSTACLEERRCKPPFTGDEWRRAGEPEPEPEPL